jgi:DNA polymerase beta
MSNSQNTLIIDTFSKLLEIKSKELSDYKEFGLDKKLISTLSFKVKNLKNVISLLEAMEADITEAKTLSSIKGIGKSTIEKIDEILQTGELNEVNNYNLESHLQFIKENTTQDLNRLHNEKKLQQINGIGPAKAKKLVDEGITLETLVDEWNIVKDSNTKIKNHLIIGKLTNSQLLGLKYYQDIQERIPRQQIVEMHNYIKNIINNIDPEIRWDICGSFRRECPDSGDIDILMTHPSLENKNDVNNSNILKQVVELLKKNHILVDDLTKNGDTKYMGIGIIPGYKTARRVDIRCVSFNSYIPALLYFTGSMDENVRLRNLAIKYGYKINEYGFYKLDKDCGIKREIPITLSSEEDLYRYLNQPYKKPNER